MIKYTIFVLKYVVWKIKNLLRCFQRHMVYKKLDASDEQYLLESCDQCNELNHSKEFIDVNFAGFSNIVVVGPQRSGTTFTAKALAAELNYKYVDEIEFLINDVYLFKKRLEVPGSVIQAPGLTHLVHELVSETSLVVYMRRAVKDILKSVKNKNGFLTDQVYTVNQSKFLLRRYPSDPCIRKILDEIEGDEIYVETMLKIWRGCQSSRIGHHVELNYESLSSSPLWLEKKYRKDFRPKQVGIDT